MACCSETPSLHRGLESTWHVTNPLKLACETAQGAHRTPAGRVHEFEVQDTLT